jgi:hypothetical protein
MAGQLPWLLPLIGGGLHVPERHRNRSDARHRPDAVPGSRRGLRIASNAGVPDLRAASGGRSSSETPLPKLGSRRFRGIGLVGRRLVLEDRHSGGLDWRRDLVREVCRFQRRQRTSLRRPSQLFHGVPEVRCLHGAAAGRERARVWKAVLGLLDVPGMPRDEARIARNFTLAPGAAHHRARCRWHHSCAIYCIGKSSWVIAHPRGGRQRRRGGGREERSNGNRRAVR